ncbi:MAG: response regulator [Betaproteobacteria bacterium]|nr:response regulator [Betaproteobacteria bacterium]
MQEQPLKIFVVDDDPSARMIVGFQFSDPVYQMIEFENGEACLAALDQQPDVILMDVEMPGMDGIATCLALREAGESRAQVIFISSHDDLETRLKAYDAGGSDYLVKPFAPEELAQKVRVAQQHLERQRGLADQAQFAQLTAFTAMSSMGELGVVLQFLHASFGCQSREQLAAALFEALGQYGLQGLVELRNDNRQSSASSQGECSPLEESILAHARSMDRIFQFSDRMVINYPCVTLVSSNLPTDDPDRVGRLRDHLAILAEGADARMIALANEERRMAQAANLVQAVGDLTVVLGEIETQQGEHRLRALKMLDGFVFDMERSFVHLGLTSGQEETLSDMARKTAESIGGLLGEGKDVGDRLRSVISRLQKMLGT